MTSRVETDDDSDNNRDSLWDLDQKLDQPMDEEAGRLRNMYREKKFSLLLLLRLAFQSLGVVYGDLGTSPLYVFYNAFPRGIKDPEDVIGALSLIIYSITFIPLLKYVFIVCRANDNGQVATVLLSHHLSGDFGHEAFWKDLKCLITGVTLFIHGCEHPS